MSFVGLAAPFVQGNSQLSLLRRLTPLLSLSAGAVVGSMVLVGLAALLSTALTGFHPQPRKLAAASMAVVLLLLDVRALRTRRLFVSGPRRQAAKWIQYMGLDDRLIGFAWGLDAGTGVSTYRVTSGTWLFLILAGIGGIMPPWTGIGYGIGFSGMVLLGSFLPQRGPGRLFAEMPTEGILSILTRATYVVVAGIVAVLAITSSIPA